MSLSPLVSPSLRPWLLALVALAFLIPGQVADGQVGPCWSCHRIEVTGPDPFTWRICWDFNNSTGQENCQELWDGTACILWGNTCQKGV